MEKRKLWIFTEEPLHHHCCAPTDDLPRLSRGESAGLCGTSPYFTTCRNSRYRCWAPNPLSCSLSTDRRVRWVMQRSLPGGTRTLTTLRLRTRGKDWAAGSYWCPPNLRCSWKGKIWPLVLLLLLLILLLRLLNFTLGVWFTDMINTYWDTNHIAMGPKILYFGV